MATSALITALQRKRPSGHTADPEFVTPVTLTALATRCQSLAAEIAAADAALQEIIDAYSPLLCDLPGVGIYRQITNPQPAPDNSDLRQMRTELGITITAAASHIAQWPSIIFVP